VSMRYFTLYARSACVLHHLLTVNLMVYRLGGASAGELL
jgi:hypothetical protein